MSVAEKDKVKRRNQRLWMGRRQVLPSVCARTARSNHSPPGSTTTIQRRRNAWSPQYMHCVQSQLMTCARFTGASWMAHVHKCKELERPCRWVHQLTVFE